MWEIPAFLGTKVILNPEGQNYQDYVQKSEGGAGWIVTSLGDDDLKCWYKRGPSRVQGVGVEVQWENGRKYMYNLRDLLPIDAYRDVACYIFNNGTKIKGFVDSSETSDKVSRYIIEKRQRLEATQLYGEDYRKEILLYIKIKLSQHPELNQHYATMLDVVTSALGATDAPNP